MSKIQTFKHLLKEDRRGIIVAIFNHIIHSGILNWMSDKSFLNLTYWVHYGKSVNWKDPRTFNEKLQWLKVYNRNPEYTKMVDKFDAKEYVANIIGEEYIIPTIGVWDRVEDVPFETLPNQYVIKCTHDSGSVCVCKNKDLFDVKKAKKKLAHGLKKNLYFWGREWPYKNVKARIIAEKYLKDDSKSEDQDLMDYKLMCFNGKVQCSFVCSDRFNNEGLKVTFFDKEWVKMPFRRHYPAAEYDIPAPSTYNKMVELAEKLSKGIPFVRVDFYEVNGHPYLGELTFFPGNGVEEFKPIEWDYLLGSWIDLSDVYEKNAPSQN